MSSEKNIRKATLAVLCVLGVLFFLTEGFGVFGVITLLFAALYFIWDNSENDDDNDSYYKFNLK